ncbi:MAG TPA: phytanoyl-CoA dioxygenase [Candidatus Latescibacteria bacterium]|nr:phytanoyl-CoA dioxygenase [Candidatus Latescibacterota bacterium]
MKKPFADDQLTEHLEKIDRVGYTILENLIPKTAITAMAAAFEPLYRSNLDTIRNNPNRGSMRHYIVLPFEPPFYQPAFNGSPEIFAIVHALLGEDAVCAQFASDTPALGSIYQDWHADTTRNFSADGQLQPLTLIAANTSFVDITPENGPFEVSDGSHHIPDAIEKLNNGELAFKPLMMKAGDVLVRDPRCIHRGTPNRTDMPRGVAVLGFDRAGHERTGHMVENAIDPAFYSSLSEPEQRMYRKVPRKAD